jgi:hypothetical protein
LCETKLKISLNKILTWIEKVKEYDKI